MVYKLCFKNRVEILAERHFREIEFRYLVLTILSGSSAELFVDVCGFFCQVSGCFFIRCLFCVQCGDGLCTKCIQFVDNVF